MLEFLPTDVMQSLVSCGWNVGFRLLEREDEVHAASEAFRVVDPEFANYLKFMNTLPEKWADREILNYYVEIFDIIDIIEKAIEARMDSGELAYVDGRLVERT